MESTQTLAIFILLTETEEANLSGGKSKVVIVKGADGQDGQDGAPGRNGADGQDGAPGLTGVQNLGTKKQRIKAKKALLKRLLSKLKDLEEW